RHHGVRPNVIVPYSADWYLVIGRHMLLTSNTTTISNYLTTAINRHSKIDGLGVSPTMHEATVWLGDEVCGETPYSIHAQAERWRYILDQAVQRHKRMAA